MIQRKTLYFISEFPGPLQMLDWYEGLLDRLLRRIHFWLISRLYPELSRIPDEKHRGWAIWYSGGSEGQPTWKRHVRLLVICCGGPLAVILPAVMLLSMMGRVSAWLWVIVIFMGWVGGFAASAATIELMRRRKAQKKNFRALRIFGYDVCLSCGYDMRGHSMKDSDVRRCPECGQGVPAMYGSVTDRAAG